MKCPYENCNKKLRLQGSIFQSNHEFRTYGYCESHGEIKFILKDKTDATDDRTAGTNPLR